MADIEEQIRRRVEAFVQELTGLVHQAALQSVAQALGQPGRGLGAPRGGAGRLPGLRPSGKRTSADLEAQQRTLVGLIKKTPGVRADQMAKTLGLNTRDLALPLKKLLADKVIIKKGQKRATAYFVGKAR